MAGPEMTEGKCMCLGKREEVGWEMHERKVYSTAGLELSIQGKFNPHKASKTPPPFNMPQAYPAPIPTLTWLLWMDMAQASWRGSCCRLRSRPPVACTIQRSARMTSVTPHRNRTWGSPEGGVEKSHLSVPLQGSKVRTGLTFPC